MLWPPPSPPSWEAASRKATARSSPFATRDFVARAETFVDRSIHAIGAIRDNLGRTKLVPNATVVQRDVARFLDAPPERFGLVFLDPPYDTPPEAVDADLRKLAAGWLAEGATVALTRPRKGYNPVIPVSWLVARRLEYGDTLVVLYREV